MADPERHTPSMQSLLAVCAPKFTKFAVNVQDTSRLTILFRLPTTRFVLMIFARKSLCHCETTRKQAVVGLDVSGGESPQILDVHLQVWRTLEYVAKFG